MHTFCFLFTNIYSVLNVTRTAQAIGKVNPFAIGLQEVDNKTERSPLDETKELAKKLGMHGYFLKNRRYQGGGYGVAILTKQKATETKEFHYHPPNKPVPYVCFLKTPLFNAKQLFTSMFFLPFLSYLNIV